MKKIIIVLLGATLIIPQIGKAQAPDFEWAINAGSSNNDGGNRIAVDNQGYTYITGYFRETASFGDIILTSEGENDIFIVKLDVNGNYVWVKSAGGEEEDFARDIAVDSQGNVYITGGF